MASNLSASPEDISKPKRTPKKLTIEEKLKVLDVKKEGQFDTAIARHFGLCRQTIYDNRKAESSTMRTAKITFDLSAEIIISPHYKPLYGRCRYYG